MAAKASLKHAGRSAQATGRQKAPPRGPFGLGLHEAFLAALIAMLVARPLLPSEGVAWGGDGQPFNLMGLLLACGVFFHAARSGRLGFRWTAADLAVAVLVECMAVSALVAARAGNPRASINMVWEWIAAGVGYFLVRLLVRTQREARLIVAVMIVAAAVISVYGYYQYAVEMPALRSQFAQNADAMLRDAGQWHPKDSIARALFESRLNSNEVFATFGLANSLSAFLAPWLIVAAGAAFFQLRRGRASAGGVGLAIAAVVIAGCLLLTKSRSGFVATAVGVGLIAVSTFAAGRRFNWKTFAGAGAIVAMLLAAAIAVKGWGGSALGGAEKSLGYRFQYWESTLAMIREHPWLGVGPGSFQDYYTHYKLPTASEEVSDPHNFFLEVWATGGTFAMLALVALLGCWSWTILRGAALDLATPGEEHDNKQRDNKQDGKHDTARRQSRAPGTNLALLIALGGLGAMVIAYVLAPVSGIVLPADKLIAAFVSGAALLALLYRWIGEGSLPRWLPAVAVVVLLVDLSAAGGITFPAVAGSLWLCLALSLNLSLGLPEHEDEPSVPAGESRVWAGVALVASAFAAGACYLTAYRPILNALSVMPVTEDEPALRAAAAADPLSQFAWERLAELELSQWIARPTSQGRDAFERARDRVLELRPQASSIWREAGQWQQDVFEKSHEQKDARQAADYFARAADLYPNSPAIQSDYAAMLAAAGDKPAARQAAATALRLDELTPHLDKKLSAKTRQRMAAIAADR